MGTRSEHESGGLTRFPIAIIGIGCRFPGRIDGPDSLWTSLCDGFDAVTVLPDDRWNLDAFYSPDAGVPGCAITRFGAFLEDIDKFDCRFFSVSPREAARMDPQQRLLLQTTWEAFEDAGIPVDRLVNSDTGVFIGISYCDFVAIQSRDLIDADGHSATGSGLSLSANRISYRFGFCGPSLAIDTACSSSLVAVDLACHSIWTGQASLAVAGGVNTILSPETTIFLSKAAMLSPDGRCKSFDARANGYVRGEGAGVVVLKPLRQALASGDRVYAVIQSTATNQDGHTPSITQPNGESQVAVIREACRRACISPAEISYVEAHGTGTSLGDLVEATAIARALDRGGPTNRPVLIGSIKTNIGHLESASGVAGLIKAALCIDRRAIPPNLHFKVPNPHIDFGLLNVRIPTEIMSWEADTDRLVAGVNSFGFGGTNAHVILSELPRHADCDNKTFPSTFHPEDLAKKQLLFPVSAATDKSLRRVAIHLKTWLNKHNNSLPLASIAGNLAYRRSHLEHRAIIQEESVAGLCTQLDALINRDTSAGLTVGRIESDPAAVFVFVGQGTQWPGMGRELLAEEPVFSSTIERIDSLFRKVGGFSILSKLTETGKCQSFDATEIAQPLIFAIQVALAVLWKSWGIKPVAVIGHSVGEVATAHVCGALSLEDAVTVIRHRSRLQQALHGRGRMLAVTMPIDDVKAILQELDSDVEIAAVNSKTAITLAGEEASLAAICDLLSPRQIKTTYINTEYAFHSRQMTPLRTDLIESLDNIRSLSPLIPMLSTVTGRPVAEGQLDAEYWWRNVRNPVKFAEGVDQLLSSGRHLFVEVGPHPVLAGALLECLDEHEQSGSVLPSMIRGDSELRVMRSSLCRLYTMGFRPDWSSCIPSKFRFIRLPTYPWENETLWQEGENSKAFRFMGFVHPLLGKRRRTAKIAWKAQVSLQTHPYLTDHTLLGDAVFPGAAYIEMMWVAGLEIFADHKFELTDVRFTETLCLDQDHYEFIETSYDQSRSLIEIHSRRSGEKSSWSLKAFATLRRSPNRAPDPQPVADAGQIDATIKENQFYEIVSLEGASFGPAFRGVKQLRAGRGCVWGDVELADAIMNEDARSYFFHPALLDACLQCIRGLMPFTTDTEKIVNQIPVKVDRIEIYGAPTRQLTVYMRERVASDRYLQSDLEIFDNGGKSVASLKGLGYVRILKTVSSVLQYYQSQWHPKPLREEKPVVAGAGVWVIFVDRQGLGREIASFLRRSGARCVLLIPGDKCEPMNADEYILRPDSREDIRMVLDNLSAPPEAIKGFMHLWSLDVEQPPSLTTEKLSAGQTLGGVSVMHLVQEILDHKLLESDATPQLLIVTAGSQLLNLGNDEDVGEIQPGQSAIWGLARVISNELPQLRCQILDLDARSLDFMPVVEELQRFDSESEMVWRAGQRYVNRIVSQRPEALPPRLLAPNRDGIDRPFRLQMSMPGVLETLSLREIVLPEPGSNEVLVEVYSAGLNFRDVMAAVGVLPDEAEESPAWQALGLECVGKIAKVGGSVRDRQCGEKVLVLVRGAFATHVIVRAEMAIPIPAGLSFEEAATIPVAFSTAYLALVHLGQITSRDKVLVHAAAGGVGLAAIQICQLAGAEIFATAGSERKRSYLRSLGIAHVMDSRSLDFAEEIMEITSGRGVDVVLNSLSGDFLHHSLETLAPSGRFLEIGKRDIYENSSLGMKVFKRGIQFFGIDVAKTFHDRPNLARDIMRELMTLFVDSRLDPLPVTTYPISDAEIAFRDSLLAKHIGKLVFSLKDPEARIAAIQPDELQLESVGTYVVTGGLSGFGLRVAEWLIDRGARSVVLAGRKGVVSEQDVGQIESMRAAGALVHIVAADVSVYEDVRRLISVADRSDHPLRGVIHSAAVFDDATLFDLDQHRFEKVLAPKVAGGWNLHLATLHKKLDFFVLFSSLSANFGTPGQGNYAAANAFLNGLARYRQQIGLPALAVNWGALGEVGFIARNKDGARLLDSLGIERMDPSVALESLGLLLSRDVAEITVASIDWERLSDSITDVPLRHRLSSLITSRDNPQSGHRRKMLVQQLAAVAPDRVVGILETFLRHQIARILSVRFDSVETDRPLQDLGLDSLAIIELKNSLELQGFPKIPLSKLKTHPTINSIVSLVLTYVDDRDSSDD